MEFVFDNFVYCAQQAKDYSFSLKGSFAACNDSIDLPMLNRPTGCYFTLAGGGSVSVLEFVKDKLMSLSLTVSDAMIRNAKRVLRRAVAGVRHFVCSNQRRSKRHAVPPVPMALRL